MTHQSVPLPVQTYQSLVYLLCPDCNQLHYFRAVKFQDGSQVRYNHPQAPDPTQFQTECPSCLAMQDNDQEAVNAAFEHTVSDPFHAVEMKQVPEFTESPPPNRVMACPRCNETCLFSTDWKGNITKFWPSAWTESTGLCSTTTPSGRT